MAQGKISLSQIAGRNLAHLLWSRNISQSEFSELVNRTTRTVRRWMYEGVPSLDDLQSISEVLGVSARDLLSDSEEIPFLLDIKCPICISSLYEAYNLAYYKRIS